MQRLIERDLLHRDASVAGLKERYTRGETQQTIHVWWARRPHAAMRALTFFSLCHCDSKSALQSEFDNLGLSEIRSLLQRFYGQPPRVLDMFGGGGTIPFEAALLGAETYSVDSNGLAAFIQAANLRYSSVLRIPGVLELLRRSGNRVLSELAQRTSPLFPLRNKSATNYVWSYIAPCYTCGHRFSLSRRPWLSKKYGKRIQYTITGNLVHVADSNAVPVLNWNSHTGQAICPSCKTRQNINLQQTTDVLAAVVTGKRGSGKTFHSALPGAVPDMSALQLFEEDIRARTRTELPKSEIPKWSGIVNPGVYGMQTHAEHFNARQRCVMLTLIECLKAEHRGNTQAHGEEIARCISCVLSALIDQLVDWNSRLSMWIPQNEQVGRALCGPGIAMLWDYAETDPVASGPSNLRDKLSRILKGAEVLTDLPSQVNVHLASATALPFSDCTFDAIITDPPYYDNIFYTALADFIYAWKRLFLIDIVPDFFQCGSTDAANELVCSTVRAGSPREAHIRYCTMLTGALREAARVLRGDGVLSFVYSHASTKGWSALVSAFQHTPLIVQNAQPLSIERRERPRAMTSEAVNTCIVLVARRGDEKESVSGEQAESLINGDVHMEYSDELRHLGWANSDAGIALFARIIVPLCNIRCPTDQLESLIRKAASIAGAVHPGFKLTSRGSL